ncbi:MAG: site-2 protease family protein [Candidatus Eremiobacteraeota bacterium]|nr:site-2 protease family protein [Candidatus Eremiobacteraeota bacterium]MBC5826300.1 site-2 protease family protein [Candidatus Eremiobacteraeota bacterium]
MIHPALLFAVAFSVGGLLKLVVFLAVLGALIVFHEFGHLVMAKRNGVTVTDFAIGFGPTIFAVNRGGTRYSVNLLPLGGYCKMVGEDEPDSGIADPGNFAHKPLAARLAIIAAGPIFNFILAAIIFAVIGVAIGLPTGNTTVVAEVQPGSPAASAGLVSNDQIIALDGQPVRSGQDMIDYIHARPNKTIAVGVRHAGAIEHLRIRTRPQLLDGKTVGVFGFVPLPALAHASFLSGAAWGFSMVYDTIVLQVVGLYEAISHHDASAVSGPVGIARVVGQAESLGAFWVLRIAGMLSVVLGIFNLLPLPALDGGRIAFLFVELLRGRPVSPEKEGLVHLTGFAVLALLFVFITYHDVVQWINGKGGL